MSLPLALELKNCLSRHPDDDPSQILERVKFAAFMRTGVEPTQSELKQGVELFLKYSPDQPRVPAGRRGADNGRVEAEVPTEEILAEFSLNSSTFASHLQYPGAKMHSET